MHPQLAQSLIFPFDEIFRMTGPIQPSPDFKTNLTQLPSIDAIECIELVDAQGGIAASIPNQPGKQGSLKVYHYLRQQFGALDARAAEHGLAVFGEHVADARANPGAHPNIDRLFDVVRDNLRYEIRVITRQG